MELEATLRDMIDRKASDIFVVAGLPLSYKVGGKQIHARRHGVLRP